MNNNPLKKRRRIVRKPERKKMKAKTDEKMQSIITNIEEEIENQLNKKAEKINLKRKNVKSILRAVITDSDVREMVRQTLHPTEGSQCLYEPKLTRAKIREILKTRPDQYPPHCLPSNGRNFLSECLSLIDENYRSSEDEEYQPGDEASDDDIILDSSYADSECQTPVPTPKSTMEEEEVDNENIGQRTRSKLPLTCVPLETIEQAFVPPDITEDMYNTECDNEHWSSFLRQFTKPLAEITLQADDPEEDPEYDVLADEETVDKEELRKDRAVRVSQRELSDLISELLDECEYVSNVQNVNDASEEGRATELKVADDDDRERASHIADAVKPEIPSKSYCAADDASDDVKESGVKLEIARDVELVAWDARPNVSEEEEGPSLNPLQLLLLKEQLAKHVQLTVTHFMQFHQGTSSEFARWASICKTMLFGLKNFSCNAENSVFWTPNLEAALNLMETWERVCGPGDKVKAPKKGTWHKNRVRNFSPLFFDVAVRSSAFLFPDLMPPCPFDLTSKVIKRPLLLSPYEECILAIELQGFWPYVEKRNPGLDKARIATKVAKLIAHYAFPLQSATYIEGYVKKRKIAADDNPIKDFFEKGVVPTMVHNVVLSRVPAFMQWKQLPYNWMNYAERNDLKYVWDGFNFHFLETNQVTR